MKTLYDTDFLLSLVVKNEPNHKKALKLDKHVDVDDIIILHLVHYEMANVLSRKYTQDFALSILNYLSALPIKYLSLSEEDEGEVWEELYAHKKKNISFVDCANLVIARKYKMKIASFDSFYPREVLIST